MVIFGLLDLLIGHRIVNVFDQVGFSQDKHDWLMGLCDSDFILPVGDVVQAVAVVGGHANHENVSITVLRLSIDPKMLVSACIMNFDSYLLFLDVFRPSVDIQDGRLVILRETILQVIANQAGFTN